MRATSTSGSAVGILFLSLVMSSSMVSRRLASAASNRAAFCATRIHERKVDSPTWRALSPKPATTSGRLLRLFSTSQSKSNSGDGPKKRHNNKSKKLRINEDLTEEEMTARLVAAFDELARKDGFDPSLAHHASDESFEDDFLDDDDDDDDIFLDDDDEDEEEYAEEDDSHGDVLDLDPSAFGLDDFRPSKQRKSPKQPNVKKETDDSPIASSPEANLDDDDDDDDMDARIRAAQLDNSRGTVSIPKGLLDISEADIRRLGFEREENPFGNDETERKKEIKLISNAMSCSACGADFQKRNEGKPGYIPPEKFDLQQKLAKLQEMQRLVDAAESDEWSVDDEIDFLLQTAPDGSAPHKKDSPIPDIDIEAYAEELGIDLENLPQKKVICKRCHGLQNFGKVEESLRPGWTDEPTMSQERFRELLRPIGEKTAVIIALIDLFDFSGSVLRELDGIAGENPVIVAANKVDLLPTQMGSNRVENWVRRELEYRGVQSLANIGGAVRLVSCKTGEGVDDMLRRARRLAEERDCDVYVVGAANAGKSTLINRILGRSEGKAVGKARAGNRNAFKGELTTSPLPGTTLKFIKIDLGDGKHLYDTPGLLVPGAITRILTPEELKMVCPKKRVEPISFRVANGKCVLVGGLARIEVADDSMPFLLTFFVANDIKLHPTDSSRADEFISKHVGQLLTPPLEPGPSRMEEIGEFQTHELTIEGAGWKEAAADISLAGLGWVAVTGSGTAKIKVSVPKGIGVSVRPPLMPFDVWEVAAKYTGGRSVRKSSRSKSTGKRRGGVGRS